MNGAFAKSLWTRVSVSPEPGKLRHTGLKQGGRWMGCMPFGRLATPACTAASLMEGAQFMPGGGLAAASIPFFNQPPCLPRHSRTRVAGCSRASSTIGIRLTAKTARVAAKKSSILSAAQVGRSGEFYFGTSVWGKFGRHGHHPIFRRCGPSDVRRTGLLMPLLSASNLPGGMSDRSISCRQTPCLLLQSLLV